MFAGGLILSTTLMLFAIWLQRTESIGWPSESFDDETDATYQDRRRRSRWRVNLLLFLCGALILVATLATPENRFVWMSCWMSVTLVLMTVLLLAALDVYRTIRHHRGKIDRMRKRG